MQNRDRPAAYEPPTLVVLGSVADLTLLDQPGPQPDILQNAPSGA
jgi:hypothetical protein